jgi:enoyl-CoA hydratase/carnithine racemase|tara:strand:- start:2180 stop:2938 length:759 start_codon:yes stop_codon:yes gene_type:complete
MSEFVTAELTDGILLVTLNRPAKKNALTQPMYAVMADAIERAQTDPDVKVVVFTGVGDMFTAGNDLGDFDISSDGELAPVARFLANMASTDVPLIAAVNGAAIGVGTTMLLHFDQNFASPTASFALPFINLGLVPEAGSSKLLVAQCGYQNAAKLLMLGEIFSALDAKDFGIVNSIADDVLVAAMAYAAKLATKPKQALRATKRLMRRDAEPLAETMKQEAILFSQGLGSPEFTEAVAAFAEKRTPNFTQFD